MRLSKFVYVLFGVGFIIFGLWAGKSLADSFGGHIAPASVLGTGFIAAFGPTLFGAVGAVLIIYGIRNKD